MDEVTFSKIEAYLNQEMPLPEREAFAREIEGNADLKAELTQYQKLILGVQAGILKDNLDDIHKRFENRKSRQMNPLWRYGIAAAIALLVAITLVRIFTPSESEKTYFALHETDPGLPSQMGVSSSPAFAEAMVAFKEGKYQQAQQEFEKLYQTNPNNDTLHYYLGLSWLEQNKPDAAVPWLKKAQSSPSSFISQKADWYLCLTYIRLTKSEAALQTLREIAQNPNHRYQQDSERAISLLKE